MSVNNKAANRHRHGALYRARGGAKLLLNKRRDNSAAAIAAGEPATVVLGTDLGRITGIALNDDATMAYIQDNEKGELRDVYGEVIKRDITVEATLHEAMNPRLRQYLAGNRDVNLQGVNGYRMQQDEIEFIGTRPAFVAYESNMYDGALPAPSNLAATPSTSGGTIAASTDHRFEVRAIYIADGEDIDAFEGDISDVSNEEIVTTTGATSSVALTWDMDQYAQGFQIIYNNPTDVVADRIIAIIPAGTFAATITTIAELTGAPAVGTEPASHVRVASADATTIYDVDDDYEFRVVDGSVVRVAAGAIPDNATCQIRYPVSTAAYATQQMGRGGGRTDLFAELDIVHVGGDGSGRAAGEVTRLYNAFIRIPNYQTAYPEEDFAGSPVVIKALAMQTFEASGSFGVHSSFGQQFTDGAATDEDILDDPGTFPDPGAGAFAG